MSLERRQFLSLLSATTIDLQTSGVLTSLRPNRIRAVLVDGFVIFDPRPIAQRAEEFFPGKGEELISLWRTRQFEYTWLRTLGGRYQNFRQVTEDALNYCASNMRLPLTRAQREELMGMYEKLPPWPDVPETLEALRRNGVRIAFLSNFSASMLDANLAAARLTEYFEPHLTTDRVNAFKPSPRAYRMGADAFELDPREIVFAAFAGWDAAGAKWFGYPTVWVNCSQADRERLDTEPDAITPDFRGVLDFLDAPGPMINGDGMRRSPRHSGRG